MAFCRLSCLASAIASLVPAAPKRVWRRIATRRYMTELARVMAPTYSRVSSLVWERFFAPNLGVFSDGQITANDQGLRIPRAYSYVDAVLLTRSENKDQKIKT